MPDRRPSVRHTSRVIHSRVILDDAEPRHMPGLCRSGRCIGSVPRIPVHTFFRTLRYGVPS